MNQGKKQPVKFWSEDDQPREKMAKIGKKNLSNAELIAILLGSGTPGTSAVDLGKEILDEVGNNLTNLSRVSLTQLKKHNGIGDAKAVTIIAAFELGYRMLGENIDIKTQSIRDAQDLFNCIAPEIIDQTNEEFWVVLLNNKHKVLEKKQVSTGGWTSTSVDIRKLLKFALDCSATTIAVAHNHPSGNVAPSKEDKALTNRIKTACDAIGINLMDHIIVGVRTDNNTMTRQNWYSFVEHGLL